MTRIEKDKFMEARATELVDSIRAKIVASKLSPLASAVIDRAVDKILTAKHEVGKLTALTGEEPWAKRVIAEISVMMGEADLQVFDACDGPDDAESSEAPDALVAAGAAMDATNAAISEGQAI